MKKLGTLLLTSAFLITSAGAVLAAEKVDGIIKSVDAQNHELTLDDGKTYDVASNVTLEGLKAGDKVTVSTEMKNGKNVASGVEQTGMGQTRAGGTAAPSGTVSPSAAPRR